MSSLHSAVSRDAETADNLEAIAAWLREESAVALGEGIDLLGWELRDGAATVEEFADRVRDR